MASETGAPQVEHATLRRARAWPGAAVKRRSKLMSLDIAELNISRMADFAVGATAAHSASGRRRFR